MRRRVCIVVSSELTVRNFLIHQLAAMEAVYDVTVVVNTRRADLLATLGVKATLGPLGIERHIAPVRDLRCLIALVRLMRAGRFDLVHSITPKAGLLAMLAGLVSRTPVRIHTFTGQVWATRRGLARRVLRLMDRIVAAAATFTLADSPSQRAFLVNHGVVRASRIGVLGRGSVSGVDEERFRPDPARRRAVRERLNIPAGDSLLLFVGRVTRDKGVLDLARAFAVLAGERPDVRLLIVGPDEEGLAPSLREACGPHGNRLHLSGFSDRPEELMASADVLCLPSYREGFGSVVIEAAAAGLPAVASRIYGVVDAVVDGGTGLLHEPGDVEALAGLLRRLTADQDLRRALGEAARRRAVSEFSQRAITQAVLGLYERLLGELPARRSAGLLAHASGRAGAVAGGLEGCGR